MKSKRHFFTVYFAATLCLLQFLIIPFLGSVSLGAKSYGFVFSVLLVALYFLKDVSEIRYSPVSFPLWAIGLLFLFAAWNAFSPVDAFNGVGVLVAGLLYLSMVVHLAGSVSGFSLRVIDALLVAGVVAAAMGLYEYFHFSQLGPSRDMLIPYLLPPDRSYRVYGMYGQPNLFSLFLNFCLLGFIYRYLHRPFMVGRWSRCLRFLPFFLVALTLFLTVSRAGLLSLIFSLSFLGWLVASGRYLTSDTARKKELIAIFLSLAVAFLIYKWLNWGGPGKEDLARNFAGLSVGTDGRFVFWTASFLIFLDNPLLGVGLDNFQYFLSSKVLQAHDLLGFVEYEAMGVTSWSHNELLQMLCEGGIVVFLLLFLLMLLFFFRVWQNFVKRKKGVDNPFFLYAHLFLLPFIFQSMLSWPLRHPALLALFLFLGGVLLSQYPLRDVDLPSPWRSFLKVGICVCCGITIFLFVQEARLGHFFRELHSSQNLEETLAPFYGFCENAYAEARVLEEALPIYAKWVVKEKNSNSASLLLPYAERLVSLKGSGKQWYLLAMLHYVAGAETKAVNAMQHAIELRPFDNRYWYFLHHLNMLSASRKTGRPLKDFYSEKVEYNISVPEFFHDRD